MMEKPQGFFNLVPRILIKTLVVSVFDSPEVRFPPINESHKKCR